jgi:hypothetical protein
VLFANRRNSLDTTSADARLREATTPAQKLRARCLIGIVRVRSRRTRSVACVNESTVTFTYRPRLTAVVAHSAAGPFPQESVSTHRRPSDGLCPRWRRSSVSTKQATASLARVRFVMSDRRPSGHRTRHMPGWTASGTTLGLRELKRHPSRCVRPGRAVAPLRAPGPATVAPP